MTSHPTHNHTNSKQRNLLISIFLNVLITFFQAVGGVLSGSLALLSDALHNFSDVLSLIVSYIANKLAKKKASTHRTFGYKRAEILAAFINAASLIIVAILLIFEAIKRFKNPQAIESDMVIFLSFLGILTNGFSVILLQKDAKDNMNMKSAYWHLLTDMMASIAVLVGGIIMKYYHIFWIDSVLTFTIAIYLIWVGYDLLKKATKVLMLFTPDAISVEKIVKEINAFKGITNIHHVHIWQLNEDEIHLEAHVDFTEDITLSQFDVFLHNIEEYVLKNYHINHVNIQPEFKKNDPKDMIVQD